MKFLSVFLLLISVILVTLSVVAFLGDRVVPAIYLLMLGVVTKRGHTATWRIQP